MTIIRKKRERKYPKVVRKHGNIMGIKVSITPKEEVLRFIASRLDFNNENKEKEKFFILTINPENLLIATKDWSLQEAIKNADLVLADGIGLAQAYKFLELKNYKGNPFRSLILFWQGLIVGLATIFKKSYLTDVMPVIKGRDLFLEILKVANKEKLKVYLFGGEGGEQEKSVEILKLKYPNVVFKTNKEFPQFTKHGQPVTEGDRKIHKVILGSIKIFDPDFIFVALNTPKQEKWIYRNLFRLNAVGAMSVGGTFNYVAGNMKLPPKWMETIGLEWVYRFIQEPKRWRRILNAFPIFPLKVFIYKLLK